MTVKAHFIYLIQVLHKSVILVFVQTSLREQKGQTVYQQQM